MWGPGWGDCWLSSLRRAAAWVAGGCVRVLCLDVRVCAVWVIHTGTVGVGMCRSKRLWFRRALPESGRRRRGEQGRRGCPAFLQVWNPEPGSCPPGPLPSPVCPGPGTPVIREQRKKTPAEAPLEPRGGRNWGYSWGNAERAVLPPGPTHHTAPHPGRQTLHSAQTLPGPEPRGRR